MKKVAIVTDSTCCLPQAFTAKYDIHIVPLVINYQGRSYRDGIDITPGEVYEIMRQKKDLPTTSTASPGAFMEIYRESAQEGKDVLCITLTSLQSKTYETAVIARNMVKEELPNTVIEVFDSRSTAGALGFIVLESARVASHGVDLNTVIATANKVKGRVSFLGMLDTLYYLKRGGRIGKAAAWAGSILQIKPILEHSPESGITMPVARPRTRNNGIDYMLHLLEDRVGSAKVHVMVHHADDLVQAEKIKNYITEKLNCVEIYITELTPMMGVHTGPGMLGIAYYSE